MATLTRPKTAPETKTTSALISGVPTPFPVEKLQAASENPFLSEVEQESPGESSKTRAEDGEGWETLNGLGGKEAADEPLRTRMDEITGRESFNELLPSIATLQKSCLMTLNNLLSGSEEWKSIVPDRRHSMPSSSSTEVDSSSSALQTLVTNLRTRSNGDIMIEIRPDNDLLFELRKRMGELSPTLPPQDAALATSLVTLLSYFDRLSTMKTGENTPQPVDTPSHFAASPPPIDMFDALHRHLSEVQLDRLASSSSTQAILWSQIDQELENVVAMCKGRTEGLPRFYQEALPPQYDFDEVYDFESLPEYDGTSRRSIDDSKTKEEPRVNDEKMRLDLEAVAMAIDRLYLVAPQLHNQRVELKSSKLEHLAQLAKKAETAPRSKKGKERHVRELDSIIDLIGKASERSMNDQAVVLEGGMESRLAKAKQKDIAKRDAFVEGLINHSAAGRMHGQDAVLQPKVRDPRAMLTLPEFIHEAIPLDSDLLKDPSVMLSLSEIVAQAPPVDAPESSREKKSRHRSLSAPPRSWLKHSKSSLSLTMSSSKNKNQESTFDVVYVAENHENLHHVLVFFTVTKQMPGVELTAEVLPPFPEHHSEGGDHLIVRSGPHSSLPLMLPARTTPGKKDVRVQSGHFEIKLGTIRQPTETSDNHEPPLLDATQLSSANPTSFLCASCSLPVVLSNKITSYRDLPSEHWEELVEAWMCHSDQKLHDQVMQHGKTGFWPLPDQAFVGGSYILFEASVMSQQNLLSPQPSTIHENWKLCRCLCGAVLGRSQDRPNVETEERSTCFRILKYAVRPITINLSGNLLKIPLSAFILEDMMEFVEAHASYRFVIRDEEEEKPRILVWLFKPRMRISYTTPKARALPKNASISAAKVLYKFIKPSEGTKDVKSLLNKYPGFPQAEYLSYPMPICRRLAALLKESNTAYPEGLRTMTGLEVGWLQRC